ncbi:Basic-leucine zipper domain [Sesbania bispinosa]|nr:Basic-leucine zipper domain [Sesbania bispinosa]
MEPNVFGALPDVLDLGSFHRRTYSDYSLHLNHTFDDLLLQQPEFNFATNDFKFPPPPPLTAAEMVLSSVVPKIPDQTDGIVTVIAGANAGEKDGGSDGRRKRVQRRHRHSNSVDVPETSKLGKKTLTDEKLSELYNVDPMKAKRILANRKSAARSKAKKMRYAMDLEMRVERLKVKKATMAEQISIVKLQISLWNKEVEVCLFLMEPVTMPAGIQQGWLGLGGEETERNDEEDFKNTEEMTARNQELRKQIEAIKQESQRKKAHNEALREEAKSLKIQIAQLAIVIRNLESDELPSQFSSQLSLEDQLPSQYQIEAPQQPAAQLPMPPQRFIAGPSSSNMMIN